MAGVVYFFLACALLILGYVFYGRLAERVFRLDVKRPTPAVSRPDGVDYVVMPRWRIFLIQLLNIAGLGPVFGALSGALFGPAALLWIVFGCILGGAVHDFMAAMISAENDGENLPEEVGRYLGNGMRHFLRVMCVILCALVGVVFTVGPAGMLANLSSVDLWVWCCAIFGYYFLATVLPIHTLIGRIYPFFGALFIFMAVGVITMLFASGQTILPDTDFLADVHPKGTPVWPMLFVTVACGAISGFHATQSPLMVRCLPAMKDGRPVFYGGMIAEGVIALIWATVGLSFHQPGGAPLTELTLQNPSLSVTAACISLLGGTGAVVAVLGVVVLPITSGDTALRCARLMLADMFGLSQKRVGKRLLLALPLFALAISLTQIDFQIIWRYFGWFNQVIATITLWTIGAALARRSSWHWMATLPALFMTAMCTTYLLYAPECFALDLRMATLVGCSAAALLFVLFLRTFGRGFRQAVDKGETEALPPCN